ncbi:MAG TPA: hypothetical protein ENK72_00745 [Epsilonproteobacteria bacterium]|nr:hypothetical protein [Campylobacterota bacterium]
MFTQLRRTFKKMFRELLVYHHNSIEYRAKILTLMVSSDHELSECEQTKLREIAYEVYEGDEERAELLVDTVKEYHNKIVTDNGLDFEHLIQQVVKESLEVPRYVKKINIQRLLKLHDCAGDEEDRIFQERILEFLEDLKEAYADIE